MDKYGQLSEPCGCRADPIDIHHAVHLPDDQPGRSLLLDSGPAADRARYDSLEQVLVRLDRILGAMLVARAIERHHVERAGAGRRRAPTHVRAVVPGPG